MLGALEAEVILLAGTVVFVAALVSSVAGFAFSALAGAALLTVLGDPIRAVAVMVSCSIAMQAYCVWSLRASIEWRSLVPFLAGGALTVPMGVWLLVHTPLEAFALVLGSFLTLYGVYMLARRESPLLRGDWRMDALAGALGGIAGGFAGFPGSFVTIWCGLRGWTKERQRAIYQPFILVMQVLVLALLHRHTSVVASAELPIYVAAALGATYFGLRVFQRLTNRQFAVTVNALLLCSGVALLGRAF